MAARKASPSATQAVGGKPPAAGPPEPHPPSPTDRPRQTPQDSTSSAPNTNNTWRLRSRRALGVTNTVANDWPGSRIPSSSSAAGQPTGYSPAGPDPPTTPHARQ